MKTTRRTAVRPVAAAISLASLVGATIAAAPAAAMRNPGHVYCQALGYEPMTVLTKKGEKAICKLTDGRMLDAIAFFNGDVGLDVSYCAQQGMQAKHETDPATCRSCTVCVLPDGGEKRVSELMGLVFRETTCGDGNCYNGENAGVCPADCPSGGEDEYCDGKSDGRCDPDCADTGLPDADCMICVGDCNGDNGVTVDELIRGVSIALGTSTIDTCPVFDSDGNSMVTVDEIVTAVNNALAGCLRP